MARTHAVSVEERRAARAAEKKYGNKIRKQHRRKQAKPKRRNPDGSESDAAKPRKPIRWKWKTVAKREIRREIRNSSKKPAIPRAAIERVIRECAPGYQFEQQAMAQLRSAAEAHIVAALEAARFVADAEQVPTLDVRHMHVVAAITNKMTTATPMPEEYRTSMKPKRVPVAAPTVIVADDGDTGSDVEEDGTDAAVEIKIE
jgi:Core histone H2A/H2B/H3/H4.